MSADIQGRISSPAGNLRRHNSIATRNCGRPRSILKYAETRARGNCSKPAERHNCGSKLAMDDDSLMRSLTTDNGRSSPGSTTEGPAATPCISEGVLRPPSLSLIRRRGMTCNSEKSSPSAHRALGNLGVRRTGPIVLSRSAVGPK
ncbi:hypothetical protein J6590_079316 [Homalodisca vitripennis]|nr:hypothetical protein J6590_079316 [Homalodisca vitripennis]